MGRSYRDCPDRESGFTTPTGTVRCFGSHRIRHATATLLVNNGMPLEDVKRLFHRIAPRRRLTRSPHLPPCGAGPARG